MQLVGFAEKDNREIVWERISKNKCNKVSKTKGYEPPEISSSPSTSQINGGKATPKHITGIFQNTRDTQDI